MEKKNIEGLISSFFLIIFQISFSSAQYYESETRQYYSNPSFSLSQFLESINPDTLTIFVAFIISFTLIYYSALKFFKRDKVLASVISFALSLSIAYGINNLNFNLQNIFYSLNFPIEIVYLFLFIFSLGAGVFLCIKLRYNALFVIGTLLILLSLTDLIYQKGFTFTSGLILIILASLRFLKKKKNK